MNIKHRYGGNITRITGIGHKTREGVAHWFFIGDVDWDDGSKSRAIQDLRGALLPDEMYDALYDAVEDYLNRNGMWHDKKTTKDGHYYCWTPDEPEKQEKYPHETKRKVT